MSEQTSELPLPLWEAAANNVIAPLLAIPELYRTAIEQQVQSHHFPPGFWRDVYPHILDMRERGKEIVGTTLSAETSSQVPVGWIETQMNRSDFLLVETFDDNMKLLKEQAHSTRDIGEYEQGIYDLKRGKPRSEVAARVISQISRDVESTIQDASADAVAERLAILLDEDPVQALTTGIPQVDNWTYGIQKKQIWWIVAHYKGWKSRLLRNIALAVARAGGSVTLGIFEGEQNMIAMQIVVMLAAEYLYQQGLWSETLRSGERLASINALEVLTLRKRLKEVWPKQRLEALGVGLQRYSDLEKHLRIYDKSKHNGRLTDLDSILSILLRDRHLYDGVDFLGLDFLQRIEAQGKIYDKVSGLSNGLQDMALYYELCVMVLSQMSEEAIKRRSESHSPGAKGGGDPAQTADFLFTTAYDEELLDEKGYATLRLNLKLARYARHSRKGSPVSVDLPVDPDTGWILPHEHVDLNDAINESLTEQEDYMSEIIGMFK